MASNNSTDGYESQKDRVRDYVTGLARQMGMGDELEEETRDDMVDKAYQVDQRDKKDAQARLWRDTDNDRRFPNVNQSQNCWTAVNEYQLCSKIKGNKRHPTCLKRRNDFLNLCPLEWVESYQDQIEEGTFMGVGDFLHPDAVEEEEEEGDDEDDSSDSEDEE
eukprot:gb/GECG01015722.1/.p1 GENE.gb/GECG01015722.1/~~gb/GECG01015722.1/.p1  ORF type:complete len:163 (+),score=37.90 gb/GECG01015722.1/:1-489(+)